MERYQHHRLVQSPHVGEPSNLKGVKCRKQLKWWKGSVCEAESYEVISSQNNLFNL